MQKERTTHTVLARSRSRVFKCELALHGALLRPAVHAFTRRAQKINNKIVQKGEKVAVTLRMREEQACCWKEEAVRAI